MPTAESMLEKDSCVICLLTEEESHILNYNSKCNCKYRYHDDCMKNIPTCPYCKIPFPTVTVHAAPIQQVQQNRIDTTDSFCFKAVFTIIVVATLAAAGYFSAILT